MGFEIASKQKQSRTTNQRQKLRIQRQALIDKNLSGIYSDTDFKEQFDMIENQLQNIALLSKQIALDKYTRESTQEYILNKLSDIPNAYETSEIKQKRTLISLFFPKGLIWNYPGLTCVE